jgi:hypothetical protein
MKRSIVTALACLSLLPGCASIDSAPRPVFSAKDTQQIIKARYGIETLSNALYASDGILKDVSLRNQIRNRAVSTYLLAIDANYFDFRRSLSRSMKLTNIGYDFTILGLTGVGSVWKEASRYVSAAATGLAGGRASVNRELYFEKTLPALVAFMETRRLQVRTEILRRLAEDEDHYTLQDAMADINRYQEAASLDGAIQQISASAASAQQVAEVDFSRAVTLCRAENTIPARRKAMMRSLLGGPGILPADAPRFVRALTASGVTNAKPPADPATAEAQWHQIGDFLLNVCKAADMQAFEDKVSGAGAPAPVVGDGN